MINLNEIDKSILELEQRDTSYAICERLAWLYIVRDHLSGNNLARSAAPDSSSEFLEAATNCDIDVLMRILNEHFDLIKAFYPKEYSKVIERIKSGE